jgi:hypothetical protein
MDGGRAGQGRTLAGKAGIGGMWIAPAPTTAAGGLPRGSLAGEIAPALSLIRAILAAAGATTRQTRARDAATRG